MFEGIWPFTKEKYLDSRKSLVDTLKSFDPLRDFSYQAKIKNNLYKEVKEIYDGFDYGAHSTVKTFKKYFDSEDVMKKELFLYEHYNDFGDILDLFWRKINVFSYGQEDDRWFIEIDYLGEKDSLQKLRENYTPEKAYELVSNSLETLAILHASAPLSLYEKKNMKDNGMDKAHKSIKKYESCIEEELDDYKTDAKSVRKGVNALGQLLQEQFFTDYFLGNDFNGIKIDYDKAHFAKGDFDATHLIEGVSVLSKKQKNELKNQYFEALNYRIEQFNDYVQECHENPRETILNLVDKFTEGDVAEKLRKKIEKKKPRTLDKYVKMIEKSDKSLKDSIYMLKNHVDNLQEREYMSRKDFEINYIASKLLRSLSCFANRGKKKKNAGNIDDFIFYSLEQMDQLEKAVHAANAVEEYALFNLSNKDYKRIHGMRVAIMNDYKKLYGEVMPEESAPVEEKPVIEDYVLDDFSKYYDGLLDDKLEKVQLTEESLFDKYKSNDYTGYYPNIKENLKEYAMPFKNIA